MFVGIGTAVYKVSNLKLKKDSSPMIVKQTIYVLLFIKCLQLRHQYVLVVYTYVTVYFSVLFLCTFLFYSLIQINSYSHIIPTISFNHTQQLILLNQTAGPQ